MLTKKQELALEKLPLKIEKIFIEVCLFTRTKNGNTINLYTKQPIDSANLVKPKVYSVGYLSLGAYSPYNPIAITDNISEDFYYEVKFTQSELSKEFFRKIEERSNIGEFTNAFTITSIVAIPARFIYPWRLNFLKFIKNMLTETQKLAVILVAEV